MMDENEVEILRQALRESVDLICDAAKVLSEMMKPFFEQMTEAWEQFKSMAPDLYELFQEYEEYFSKKADIEAIRSGWHLEMDTRKISQVMDRRPRVIVRKVIG